MPDIDRQINTLEMRLTRKPSVVAALALAARCWLAYRLSSGPEPRAYLHKANHTIASIMRKNESDIRLMVFSTFISIEGERFDNANETLDTAIGFKGYLKSNEPLYYAAFYFLYAYLEIRQKRARSARKYMRVLEDFVKQAAANPLYDLMLGALHLAFYEYAEAFVYLARSYENGSRSVFLYVALFEYYRTALNVKEAGITLLPALRWAAARGADVEDIINVFQNELRVAVTQNPGAGELIYTHYPNPVILRALCECHMLAGDFNPLAYARYRDAERRQLAISGLYSFLVKAAYVNKAERVNHYAMKEFLRGADMDAGLKMYVYHLLLTDQSLSDLLPDKKNEILQFCTYCLENDMEVSRMANSLYYYFWMQCNEMRVTGANVDKAEAILYENLTKFEVTAPQGVRFIYVAEREKKGMAVYELTPDDTGVMMAVVTATDADFTVTCLGAGRRSIISGPVTVRRMVSRAEPALYRYFFKKGARDFALLSYLANYYLSLLTDTTLPPPEEAIPVFTAVLADKDIAKPYKMRVQVALGGLYYRVGRFDRALECYGGADENYLDDAYVEQILSVFLQTHEWARAAGIIMRKGRLISGKVSFNALKQLSGSAHAEHHAHLADTAYDLLLKSWYDPDLLAIVLKHYNGGQAEWQALSRALSAVNTSAPQLDEIILRNSIWMHQFDEDAQKTFVRMVAREDVNRPLLKQFIMYCAYEMILNDVRPDYETLTLLEKTCLTNSEEDRLPADDNLLMYALCHVYLRNNLTTFQSDRILTEALTRQETDGLLFPVFRQYRDKRPPHPYVEKNQPFMYRSLPGKNVWLYYRIDDEAHYHAQPMRYLRFGLYLTTLALFYNEKLTYYFSEEMPTGSITTREKTAVNEVVYLEEHRDDPFFTINNALIYERMFKYDQVEKIITGMVKDVKQVRSGLM